MNRLHLTVSAAVIGASLFAAAPASAWHRDHGYYGGGHGYGYGRYHAPPRFAYRPPHRWSYWRHHRRWDDRFNQTHDRW